MPQLVKLQDELKDTGFVLVATHVQNETKENVVKLLKQNKVNFVVTSGGSVPNNPVSTIPAAFLFDSSGKLVDKGSPLALKAKLHKLVETEPHFLAAGRTYTKLAAVAESLKKTTAYGQVIKKLEKDLKAEGAKGEEAKYLADRLTVYGEKLLEKARKLESEDAFKAHQSYADISARYKGVDAGGKADARLKELKTDKAFQEELKAATIFHSIQTECANLIWQEKGKISLESPANKKIAPKVVAYVQMLKKKFPNSKAAGRVDEEISIYGFKKA